MPDRPRRRPSRPSDDPHPVTEAAAPAGGFVADSVTTDAGAAVDAWRYEGALTLDNAARVMAAADATPLPASGIIDLRALAPADSAALAVVMALRRRADAEGRTLHVRNMPPALQSLAIVYGVDDLVPAG